MQTKICTKCNQEKNIFEFSKAKLGKFGVQSVCKSCVKKFREENQEKIKKYREENKEKLKEYYQKNKQKINEYGKKWREKNKEKLIKQGKKYKQENKKKINLYQNKRYYSDINFKFSRNLRSRFYFALRNNYKHGSAVKMLGCSLEEFKNYFQALFTEGMTWEKVFDGSIHIDHKRPLASFDLSKQEEQEKACHYTNLQPLWAIDNLKKHDKWEA